MGISLLRTIALMFICLDLLSGASGQEPAAPDYSAAVAPILAKYCAGCHNEDDRDGDFSLETYEALQAGTDDGPAFLPGDAAGSRIYRLMTGAASPRMPPRNQPRPSADDIAVIQAWIDAGAKGPAGKGPDPLALIVPTIAPQATVRPVTALDASRDGHWLAVARYGAVALHRLSADGQVTAGEPSRVLGPFPGKVTAVHFTADGKRLVTASGVAGLGGSAAIWNLDDGSLVREFQGHRDLLHDAELAPDGRTLATCGYDSRIQLWNAETGELGRRLDGHNGAVYDLAFSPDGRFLISGSADDTCKVWRIADGLRMDTLSQPLKEVYSCTFSPDGRFLLASGADNNIRVWQFVARDKPDGNPMTVARFAHEGPIVRSAFSPNGARLVTLGADRTVKVWDTADYSELRAWQDQPDVAMALAIAADGASFHVGRLDGTLARFAIPTTREGVATADIAPRTIVTAAPIAGDMAAVEEREPNHLPAQAQEVVAPARIAGVIAGRAGDQPDFDLFRFAARAGQEWVIEVDAARSQSPLDSFVAVLDSRGEPIERVRLQAVRDSYFTFRGKDDVAVDDFRLFNWEEMRLQEYLYANGEVVKLWLYPRGPDSGFMVYPGQGRRWGYFDTTPLAHALGEPCYVVEPHPPGTVLKPNGLPVFSLYFENDDEARRTLGKDSRLLFTAPADGSYLVKIQDVRGYEGAQLRYTLTIRPRQPDFRVTLSGADPTLAAGGAKEFKVIAERLDGFDGPIRVEIGGLPPGFSASTPLEIEAGQIEALGVLWASPTATAPTPDTAKASTVRATARIGDADVVHDVNNLGEIRWSAKVPLRVAIQPAPSGPPPIQAAANGLLEFEARPGATMQLQVRIERNGQKGSIALGKEGSGRNLPFGTYIDNLGLNGLLIPEEQDERTFFLSVDAAVPAQSRLFHLQTSADGGQASQPVWLHIRR